MQGPAITQDFVMSQLRLALVALFAYGGGKGWFTPADTTFYLALMTSLGPLLAPWIWSIVSNLGTVRINSNSAAAVVANVEKTDQTAAITGASAATAAVVKILLIAFALSFLVAGNPAFAQVNLKSPQQIARDLGFTPVSKPTATLDNIATILAKPFQDIATFIGEDADAAVSLSTIIPALQDGHGQQCWIAMKSFGDIIKAHPVPITFHIINDYETLRLLGIATNNLCSNVHCTQVFADATAMAQAASPMPLAIPSLHDLCTKVPQIAVVAPVTVAAPTTP